MIAQKEKVEVLILGAYGCGAFHNPPDVVAKAFKHELKLFNFDKVEFAVYCRPDVGNNNYFVFKDIMSSKSI